MTLPTLTNQLVELILHTSFRRTAREWSRHDRSPRPLPWVVFEVGEPLKDSSAPRRLEPAARPRMSLTGPPVRPSVWLTPPVCLSVGGGSLWAPAQTPDMHSEVARTDLRLPDNTVYSAAFFFSPPLPRPVHLLLLLPSVSWARRTHIEKNSQWEVYNGWDCCLCSVLLFFFLWR